MKTYFAPQSRIGPELELLQDVRLVVADDGRISALESGVQPRAGDLLLPGTLVPGLIDLHVHLALDGGADVVASLEGQQQEQLCARARANAHAHLTAGVTSVRDLGAPKGVLPSLLGTTPLRITWASAITPPGGHGHFIATEARGAAATRTAVDEAIADGAHWIKMFATGGVITAGSEPGELLATPDELSAAVERARDAGVRVAAHAHGTAGILAAIEAGCDTVEHVSHVDERVMAAFQSSCASPVSTFVATDRFVTSDLIESSSADAVRKIRDHAPREAESLRRLVAGNIVMGAGTDAGTTHNAHGRGLAAQAAALCEAGMEPIDVLRTVTVVNARFVEDDVGVLALGMQADFAVFDGDPARDSRALARPRCTAVGGRIISGGPLAAVR